MLFKSFEINKAEENRRNRNTLGYTSNSSLDDFRNGNQSGTHPNELLDDSDEDTLCARGLKQTRSDDNHAQDHDGATHKRHKIHMESIDEDNQYSDRYDEEAWHPGNDKGGRRAWQWLIACSKKQTDDNLKAEAKVTSMNNGSAYVKRSNHEKKSSRGR